MAISQKRSTRQKNTRSHILPPDLSNSTIVDVDVDSIYTAHYVHASSASIKPRVTFKSRFSRRNLAAAILTAAAVAAEGRKVRLPWMFTFKLWTELMPLASAGFGIKINYDKKNQISLLQ